MSYDDFIAALENDDAKAAIQAIESDPEFLLKSDTFEAGTALHEAAYFGMIPVIEYLLKAGIKVNKRGRLGDTPLHQAIQGQHMGAVLFLLDSGAELDAGLGSELTPLFSAVCQGNVDIAKSLIEKGADVNASIVTTQGISRRPIDYAEFLNDRKMVTLLKQAGATKSPEANGEPTVDFHQMAGQLATCVERVDTRMIRTILFDSPELADYSEDDGLIQIAAKRGNIQLLQLAIHAGASMNPQHKVSSKHAVQRKTIKRNSGSPLRCAVSEEQLDAAKFLLENGADPNLGLLLVDAVFNRDLKMAKLLLSHGAEVNKSFFHMVAGYPRNALEIATKNEDSAMIRLLKKYGAKMPDVAQMAKSEPELAPKYGLLLLETAHYEDAIEVFNIAIVNDPTAELYYQRGVAFDMLERLDSALADFTLAIELDGEDFRPLYSRALVFRKQDRWAEAKTDFESALRINDTDVATLNHYALVFLQAKDASVQDASAAVQWARRACELSEYKDPICLKTLAQALEDTGETKEPADLRSKAQELQKNQSLW